jgi:uncharacterized protein (TIGR00106 family)
LAVSKKISVIADFSITPIGLGTTSLGRYIGEAVNAMNKVEGVRCQVTAMGTILEAEKLEVILEAVKAAHEAVSKMGVQRMESTLRIDDRRDKPRTMEDKVEAIKSYMQK